MSGLFSTSSAIFPFTPGCSSVSQQMAHIKCVLSTSWVTSLMEASWMVGASRPLNVHRQPSNWKLIVRCFQWHLTGLNFSWMVIDTLLNWPWHKKRRSSTTLTEKGGIGLISRRSRSFTSSLMKLWVELLSMKTTTVCPWIVAATLMVQAIGHPVRVWREISYASSPTVSSSSSSTASRIRSCEQRYLWPAMNCSLQWKQRP